MKTALVVGGGNGIGLALTYELIKKEYEKVIVVDRDGKNVQDNDRIVFEQFNLLNKDYAVFDQYLDVDALFITAGFGRLAFFEKLHEQEIINLMRVNAEAVIRIIYHFYNRIASEKPFTCAVMGSIAGLVNSPLFSVYSASKAGVCKLIEALNTELEFQGYSNRILNVSPGNIKGTCFEGGTNTDIEKLEEFVKTIVQKAKAGERLYIPQYDDVFANVINRSNADPQKFGFESIVYKEQQGRLQFPTKPQLKVGYLSGTFDLFHIGHLNLLRRAKQYCDFLVVGVHKDASHKGKKAFIPYEERKQIVESISYVDMVIQSCKEDVDVYKNGIVKYDYLFVGSDYKGTDRFNAYEQYFADKNVKIIYFPYTQGTSSTELREAISK